MTIEKSIEETVEHIASKLRSEFDKFIGEMPSYESVKDEVEKVLKDIKDSLDPITQIKVVNVVGGDDGVFTVNLSMPPEYVARMVNLMYKDGETHEYITGWLYKYCPAFKDFLVEVDGFGNNLGRGMWVLKN